MGRRYSEISDELRRFIEQQKLFFVATATGDSRINLSPKGMDSLRILGKNSLVWLNLTGSGNETSAHVQQDSRMTMMFCAFDGDPMILRLYGYARVFHPYDPEWEELISNFNPLPGARQVFDFSVDLVQTSCGMGVPLMDYVADRDQLNHWAERKGEEGLRQYWTDKNQRSLDGVPTHVLGKDA